MLCPLADCELREHSQHHQTFLTKGQMGPEKSNATLKEEALKGPGYFYCEKTHCRLKIDVCLKRQVANLKRRRFEPIPFLSCQNCSQGVENLRLQKNGGHMDKGQPSQGNGIKNIACEKYKECLDIAIKKEWKTFNCEKCPSFADQKQSCAVAHRTENKKVCERCGKRPPIQPNAPYCSLCLTDMKRAKQKAADAQKKKNEGVSKHKTEKAQETPDTAVKIDFGKYVSVLDEIEKLADKEMRPLGMQVAYILQKYIENARGCNGHEAKTR